MGAWDKIKTLFSGKETSPLPQRNDARHSLSSMLSALQSIGKEGAAHDLKSLQANLLEIFRSKPELAHDRLFILSLADIREGLGARWSDVLPSIHNVCESALKRHLSSSDISIRYGGEFFVLYLRGSAQDAQRRARAFADDVLTAILGENHGFLERSLSHAAREADKELRFKNADALDPLKHLLAEGVPTADGYSAHFRQEPLLNNRSDAKAKEAGAVSPPHSTSGLMDALLRIEGQLTSTGSNAAGLLPQERVGRLVSRLEKLEQEIAPPPQTLTLAKHFEAFVAETQVHTAQKGTASRPDIRPFGEGLAQVRSAPKSLADIAPMTQGAQDWLDGAQRLVKANHIPAENHSDGILSPAETNEVDFQFMPAWHVTKRVVSTYWFELIVRENGEVLPDDAVLPADGDPASLATIDRVMLLTVLNAMQKSHVSRKRSIVCIPVHHTTLNATGRMQAYLSVCRRIPNELRRYIVWELVGPQGGAWHSQLFTVVAALRPYGRAVLLRDSLDNPMFSTLKGLGVFGVGVDLSGAGQREGTMLRKLDKFIEKANEIGLRTYIRHCPSLSAASYAVGAGVDYLDGHVIAAPVDQPMGIRPFGVHQLYNMQLAC